MRVVVLVGSEPASAEPRRIERNGIAMMRTSSVAVAPTRFGRRLTNAGPARPEPGAAGLRQRVGRGGRPRALRWRRESTRGPMKLRIAGSSVSAAMTVHATAMLAATATP